MIKSRLCAIALLALLVCLPCLTHGDEPRFPAPDWTQATPASLSLDTGRLESARDYALQGGGAGLVIYRGMQVFAWGDISRRFELKSSTKSIGATVLGLALEDRKVALHDPATKHHPSFGVPPTSNAERDWLQRITLFHLATQTAGFDKPGGYSRLLFEPGTAWAYSDCGPNWLAECLTCVYQRDLKTLLFERFFGPLGITEADLTWRENDYRDHQLQGVSRREFGSGVAANVDALARIGYCYLREGRWSDLQLLPASFVDLVRRTPEAVQGLPVRDPERYGHASDHYGLLWWNNNDDAIPGVPVDAYWSWGLYDSLMVVIPSLNLVVARAGDSFRDGWGAHYDKLAPFLAPIVAALPEARVAALPPSERISLTWAPPDTVKRAAEESDNWPLAWGDDDTLYTAYGDGYGFAKDKERKLSLGLATITGTPGNFVGTNLQAPTAERLGDGPKGLKASGIAMVDGTLYLLARNAGNARLAWSDDRGRTWTWSDWRFEESFGCPSFLDAGRDYGDAKDDYVYVLSQDNDSAYEPADGFVLARVPRSEVRFRNAYTYFSGWSGEGTPTWSEHVSDRAAILRRPASCYRGSITYASALDAYLLCTIYRQAGAKTASGLDVFEAEHPWGPWRTVYSTSHWDVDPGESARIPSKWIATDGKRIHLVFSGGDCFAVRAAELRASPTMAVPR